MKKFTTGFFAVFFQLIGLIAYTASGLDYGDLMAATFVSELIAFLIYFWLFVLLKNSKYILHKIGMALSAGLAFVSLAAYIEIRGFLG